MYTYEKFPLKPIGTIVKLVSENKIKKCRSSLSFFVNKRNGVRAKVLMEYFSDTNVCLVCSQIQSILASIRINSCKNAFWCLTSERRTSSGEGKTFSIACVMLCALKGFLSVECRN